MKGSFDLNSIPGLNEEVRSVIPGLINSLDKDSPHTASLMVELTFKALPDSDVLISWQTLPVFASRAVVARRDLMAGINSDAEREQLLLWPGADACRA